MRMAILYQDGLREYDFGAGHPFRGERFSVFMSFLRQRLREGEHYDLIQAEPATDEDLLLICTKKYIDFTTAFYEAAHAGEPLPGYFYEFFSVDNVPASRPGRIHEAARLIVGQARMACDLVLTGRYRQAVSVGGGLHHAKPSYGEGFCVYNDVAFCAQYLIQKYGLTRILVLDTDAHAGNGTCEYFYSDPRVLFIDLHQNPRTIYPGTGFARDIGAGEGRGFTVNVPMPVGAGDSSYALVFETIVEPLCHAFQPQIIIRNGGSDPHFADRLTNLGLTVSGFRMIGEKVRKMAEICNGKVIDLITSGYNLNVLPFAWLALIAALGNLQVQVEEPQPPRTGDYRSPGATSLVIDEVKRHLSPYWRNLA